MSEALLVENCSKILEQGVDSFKTAILKTRVLSFYLIGLKEKGEVRLSLGENIMVTIVILMVL